jgi:hypothetical protein
MRNIFSACAGNNAIPGFALKPSPRPIAINSRPESSTQLTTLLLITFCIRTIIPPFRTGDARLYKKKPNSAKHGKTPTLAEFGFACYKHSNNPIS